MCVCVRVCACVFVFVCCLAGSFTSRQNAIEYLRDVSAQTGACAAILRLNLQIKLSASSSHSTLTPGQPVSAPILAEQPLN